MKSQFMFSGIGGQGVISIGELICQAAVRKGYTVTFSPSYGQEKRGGRTMCQMTVAEKMGSPIISEAELLLVMDDRSLKDYEAMVKPGGKLIINSNLVSIKPERIDIDIIRVPVNDLAMELGNAKTANMVALGVAMKYLNFVSLDEVKDELKSVFPGKKEKLIPVNRDALDKGYTF
ncbi:2-oxoacid:acceptor oxidoreductase family protein [Anaerotignum lactatifermentans]|uniref:2-oxoacid:acceptor oxidoreductase family protein n=1 Tax=Anaerotignum lactatifermentans TaxID=160404 RepID=UPI0018755A6E|nr:2-oxoacid:acceptor oxidoreductase family protein [Anaerotignum lactatifermentans]MBE5077738.1 2-oxoacid:acceptor oxidoreductase family protein [Anaerotignum lactatifermentans]